MCHTEFPSSNNLLHYTKLRYSVTPHSKAQRDNQLQNTFSCIDAESADGEQLFNGFQKIRALEKDPLISDLATPNFATYVEKMSKKETETTEDETEARQREVGEGALDLCQKFQTCECNYT